MISLFEFSQRIRELKKEKRYSEALSYFREYANSFSREDIARNRYIICDIITCFRYANQFDAGLKFLETYNINISYDQDEAILVAYGWLLWSKYKNENFYFDNFESDFDFEDEDEVGYQFNQQNLGYHKSDTIVRIEQLLQILLHQDSRDESVERLISSLFSLVLKVEKNKNNPDWKFINDFCDMFDPDQLSTDCRTIQREQKGRIKEVELASDRENWYVYKSKALMKLGMWKECLEVSKEALEKIDKFHYSNDVWFAWRIALSKRYLGNIDDAIKEMEAILKKKPEWFVQKEIAELYFENNDLDKAFKIAIDALNNSGQLESKVKLIYLLGEILNRKGERDLSFKHFMLVKLIRQDKGWKMPQKLTDELKNFRREEVPPSELENLKAELKRYWSGFIPEHDKGKKKSLENEANNLQGEIVELLHDNERGKDGFIKSGDDRYYFSAPSTWYLAKELKVGVKVLFKVEAGKDGRKKARILKLLK